MKTFRQIHLGDRFVDNLRWNFSPSSLQIDFDSLKYLLKAGIFLISNQFLERTLLIIVIGNALLDFPVQEESCVFSHQHTLS
jgi:hypothetical protein